MGHHSPGNIFFIQKKTRLRFSKHVIYIENRKVCPIDAVRKLTSRDYYNAAMISSPIQKTAISPSKTGSYFVVYKDLEQS